MNDASRNLYAESIVIDTAAPLASCGKEYRRYMKGGFTAIAPSIIPANTYLADTIRGITEWYVRFQQEPDLMQILTVDDIYQAKAENKTGIILSFQGGTHLQGDLSLIDVYYRLGIRQIQLCYNRKNDLGDGCEEPGNGGLSQFGEKAIKEMNRLGILVDLAHTGYRTMMEAMEISDKPCIVSHGNAYSIWPSGRNLKDEQVLRVAKMGGTVGVNGFPAFISANAHPKLNDFIDHIDYYVNLVGIDHVTLGMDYWKNQSGIVSDAEAMLIYEEYLNSGSATKENYPAPPYHYPEGIDLPEKMPNIVPALQSRGYADSDIKKLLGLNYIRVLKDVW